MVARTEIECAERGDGWKEMRSQMTNSITPAGRAEAEEAILNYPQQQTKRPKLRAATMEMEGLRRKGEREGKKRMR